MMPRFMTRKILLIGIGACVLLVLVGGGLALTMAGSRVSQVSSAINGALTATAVQAPTDASRALVLGRTATAISVATSMAAAQVEQANNTATAVTLSHATAVAAQQTAPAATATEQAVTAGAHQVFHDEFADNHNAWFTGRFKDNESNSVEDGVFRVVRDTKGSSFELYQQRPFTNFIADIDCRITEAPTAASCGLIFGSGDAGDRWEFEAFNDYYRLSIKQGDTRTIVAEGNPTGAVQPNTWNTLRVARRDGVIRLYLNDKLLASVSDDRLASGMLGVATSSYQEQGAAEIQFDNFTIWEIR